MRLLLVVLTLITIVGCEKKPSEKEIAEQEAAITAAKAAKPSPSPGNWMWNKYQNPLEKKPVEKKTVR